MAKQEITDREEGGKKDKLPLAGYNNPRICEIRDLMIDLNNSRRAFHEIFKNLQGCGNAPGKKLGEDYDERIKSCIRDCASLISQIEYNNVVNNLWPDLRGVIAKLEKRHNHE